MLLAVFLFVLMSETGIPGLYQTFIGFWKSRVNLLSKKSVHQSLNTLGQFVGLSVLVPNSISKRLVKKTSQIYWFSYSLK